MAPKNAIPRLEERLSVAKRAVATGRVRVRKTVRKRRQTLDIPEELHIEMRTSRVGARRDVVLRSENVEVTRDRERQPRSQ